jgi:hypothetical protein
MAAQSITSSPSRGLSSSSLLAKLFGLVSFGLLLSLIVLLVIQIVTPLPPHPLVFVQDVALPGVLPNNLMPFPGTPSPGLGPLSPGVAVRFDHFDFQSLDPNTHLLFIAHTGPAPDKEAVVNDTFKAKFKADPDATAALDGHVLVFDTTQNKLVGRVNIPQIAGIVAAPDLGEVFAAGANDGVIYVFDEHTLKVTAQIPLGADGKPDPLESPDAIEYDPIDHKVFVSDPGVPSDTAPAIDRNNQNVTVIDARTKKVIIKINVGHLPKLPGEPADPQQGDPSKEQLGYDVGHNHYDPISRHLYVTLQQLQHDVTSQIPPPPVPGTGELAEIDPVTDKILRRVQLPTSCSTPHGMILDGQQHEAFIVCVDVNPDQHIIPNLMRVDIQSMKVIPGDPTKLALAAKPDIAIIDQVHHVVFVGCVGGVAMFDESNGQLRRLGVYTFGKNAHTVVMNEKTNLLYLPQPDIGGRPVLRIVKYDPNAAA